MKHFWVRLKHYLLVSLTFSFIAGILLHHFFPLIPLPSFIFSLLLFPPILFSWNRKKQTALFAGLLLFTFFLGFFHASLTENRNSSQTAISTKITKEEDTVLIGILKKMPLFDGKKSTVIIRSTHMRLRDETFFSSTQGLVQLRLKEEWPSSIVPGDTLVIRTTLSRPYRFGNPGGFDYPAYLKANSIEVIGRISSIAHIHLLAGNASWLHSVQYLPERIRLSIKDRINNIFPPQEAGMYRALLIGDRSGLTQAQLEAFKASGIFHILAISGLHLSIVASFLFGIIYWLARRSTVLMLNISCKKLALLTTIPLLCGYALLAGFQTPVQRSLIMILLFILSFCVQRKPSPFTTLSFAALIILLLNPAALFTASFQLSFAAVASLILILPQLQSILKAEAISDRTGIRHYATISRQWITAALLVSVVATIGTAPLLISSFNRISTVGPLVNLLLEPLLCLWSLPIGLLGVFVLFIHQPMGEWLLNIGGIGITGAASVTDFFAQLEFSTLWLPTPSITLILLYYLSLSLCFLNISLKKTLPVFLIVCVLFVFPPESLNLRSSTESELVFLDVGQGSSTFINFSGGKKVLIDGGGSSSEKFNVGDSIIAPYLWDRGIIRLDAVVITHPDSDHFNGIPFILKRFKPDILWINGNDGHNQEYDDLLNLAESLGIEIRTPQHTEILLKSNGDTLQNIANPYLNRDGKLKIESSVPSNDESLILKFTGTNRKLSCLFPGDITKVVEKVLVQNSNKSSLQSTFILSPHHGSKTSNTSIFLDSIHPEQIIVSAGRFRPLLFPSPALKLYCKENSIPLLNTAESGAISIKTEGDQINIVQFM